ncbi:MAG: hypothetical protein CMH35_04960 [Microbacterium sp.]|nr:hypothetical protein [Microbacterium sp.]
MAVDERWVVFVRVADRSGTLTALSECFSTRGVSFEAFSTLDVHGGEGHMAITFRASRRLAEVLVRTLGRFTAVRGVRLERAGDPRVRATAAVEGVEVTSADGVVTLSVWSGVTLLAGSLDAVERAVDTARGAGATAVSLTVLPPLG